MQRFRDTFLSREHRFSLGVDEWTGDYYLSTPVSGFNRAVEWEAYFVIDEEQHARFRADPAAADPFTELCRMGANKHLLIEPKP
jgi:hypothetical protein